MPKTLERALAFEEATLGRALSWKGVKVIATVAITGHLLEKASRMVSDKRDQEIFRKAYAEQRERQLSAATATDEPGQNSPESTHIVDVDQVLTTENEEPADD